MKKRQPIYCVLLICSIVLATSLLAVAQETMDSTGSSRMKGDSTVYYKERAPMDEGQKTSFFSYLVRVIFVTVFLILFIIFGFQWYIKYVLQKSGFSQDHIKIVGRRAIGPKQFIVLVSMEGKKYALGVTDHSINLLTDLGEVEEAEDFQQEAGHPGSFSNLLRKLSRGQNAS
jgi:flagellar biosynthetic protein FliO